MAYLLHTGIAKQFHFRNSATGSDRFGKAEHNSVRPISDRWGICEPGGEGTPYVLVREYKAAQTIRFVKLKKALDCVRSGQHATAA